MSGEKLIGDYSSAATLRCERVLGTLLRSIGAPWRARTCLIGGLAPVYLLPNSATSMQRGHVGSTDVDLVVSIALGAASDGAYSTLETNIKRAGLGRHRGSSWRWSIEVEGQTVVVELIGDAPGAEGGTLFAPRIKPSAGAGGTKLLCVKGAELALLDAITVRKKVELLDGSVSSVDFRVAGLAPFVALKADAYLDRREPKDVYDLVYVLRNWPYGPRGAAATLVASPLANHRFVASALTRLARDFVSETYVGPRDYARFVTGEASGQAFAAMRDEALLVWRQFEDERGRLTL